jgi:hypothetical protein
LESFGDTISIDDFEDEAVGKYDSNVQTNDSGVNKLGWVLGVVLFYVTDMVCDNESECRVHS